jgi:O-antigen ligase
MKKHRVNLRANTLTVIMALGIAYGIVTPMVGGFSFGDYSSVLGRDETLTGRTDIWAAVVPFAMEKAVLGGGIGSFWTSAARQMISSEAHNGYLDALLQFGFIGLFLIAMFLLSYCRKAQRVLAQDFDWGALWVCFLLMAVIHNITESSIDSFTSHLTTVLLFLAVSLTDLLRIPQEAQTKGDIA